MKKSSLLVVGVLCVASSLPNAKAQDLAPALDPVVLGQGLVLSATMHAHAERDAARLGRRSARRTRRGSTTRRSSVVRGGSTRFQTSAAVRQRVFARFVANTRQVDPRGAASLQREFAKGDPIAAIAPDLRRYNLRTDDVADSATAYLLSAWYGVRGRTDDPPRAYINGVREQMRGAVLATPAVGRGSNSTKQQISDSFLVQTLVINATLRATKGNPAQLAQAKAAIGQGARKSFQVDLAKMKLTSTGIHR